VDCGEPELTGRSLRQRRTSSGARHRGEEFAGKIVVVTGAASGIGNSVAERFARRGARVFGVGRDETINARGSKSRPGFAPVMTTTPGKVEFTGP
jgi:phosphoglycerate dehydrogenase-like enzyme